jgi:hypothetical protein
VDIRPAVRSSMRATVLRNGARATDGAGAARDVVAGGVVDERDDVGLGGGGWTMDGGWAVVGGWVVDSGCVADGGLGSDDTADDEEGPDDVASAVVDDADPDGPSGLVVAVLSIAESGATGPEQAATATRSAAPATRDRNLTPQVCCPR